jgi:hypothetical protein
MHSYLITGGSKNQLKEKIKGLLQAWQVKPSDIFHLQIQEEKQSLGISEIRLFTKHLYLAPASSFAVGVIEQAEMLTLEAQNALLKTLEEPPKKARIILCAPSQETLLPTIRSRCQSISLATTTTLSEETKKKIIDTIEFLKGKNRGELCAYVTQTFGKKDDGIAFIQSYLQMLHASMTTANTQQESLSMIPLTHTIAASFRVLQQLNANVSPTLIFDSFFFTILPRQDINRDVQ